jgi:hypothetical protein
VLEVYNGPRGRDRDETLNLVDLDDYDFPLIMWESGARFQALSECLYLYRDHRESFLLTTRLRLSTHSRELRRILRNNGAHRLQTEQAVARAKATCLRQCLYRTRFDRWLKERLGYGSRRGWRAIYK